MSIPKEPRQMMINLMYLVLTAMLALNITREVLNAFNTINDSLEQSNSTIADKNTNIYALFDKAAEKKEDQERVLPLRAKAYEVKDLSEKLVNYLQGWKDSVIIRSGGWKTNDKGEKEILSMENIDASTKLFVEGKKGNEIKSELQKYVDALISKIEDPNERDAFRKQLPLNLSDFKKSTENPSGDWSHGNFNNVPVVGAVALFSKFQNDVRNAEATMVERLYSKINEDQLIITGYMPVAVANTSYALQGDDIEVTVALAAYNKAVNPNISSNRGPVQVKDGVGTMKFKASGVGLQTVNGTISMPVKGKVESWPYKLEYTVGNAGASLQLDKMNVMFIGLDNPITISASGYNIQDVNVQFDGAQSVTKLGDGKFNVRVNKVTNDMAYRIIARARTGQTTTVNSGVMRVRSLPNPTATWGQQNSGFMATTKAKAQQGIVAQLENFYYDTKWDIVSYTLDWIPKNGQGFNAENRGARANGEVAALINRSKPGDKLVFSDVVVKGPDGRNRTVNPISLTLN